jgi:hypothetical protein
MYVNLTQHNATPEQVTAGVVDLPPERQHYLRGLLTYEEIPCAEEIRERADDIAALAEEAAEFFGEHVRAMIGGAPYLMSSLEDALRATGIEPVYAFSARESVEEALPDGSVRKTTVFRHVGFVPAGTRR